MGDGGRAATHFFLPLVRLKTTGRGLASVAVTWGRPDAAASQTAGLIGVDLRSTQRGRPRVDFLLLRVRGGIAHGGRAATQFFWHRCDSDPSVVGWPRLRRLRGSLSLLARRRG